MQPGTVVSRKVERPAELVVFSHPNHEIAIFGLLQRWQPALLYLTDGGGADRVAETQAGLRAIGLLERATFLDYSESSFYEALLDRDETFFLAVAAGIAESLDRWRPARVLCDAIEYYNPVHDLSLPLVLRALAMVSRGDRDVEVLEIPLIRQVAGSGGESYAVQRAAPSRDGLQQSFRLTAGELTAKRSARDHVYTILAAQLGSVIVDLPDEHLATETLLPAVLPAGLAPDSVLRYEWRAQMLQRRGAIERPITYAGHFLPMARSLAGGWIGGPHVTSHGTLG